MTNDEQARGLGPWRVHIEQTATDWARDVQRLTIYRRGYGQPGQQIVAFNGPTWEIGEVPEGAIPLPGFPIPTEALESLRAQLGTPIDVRRAALDFAIADDPGPATAAIVRAREFERYLREG